MPVIKAEISGDAYAPFSVADIEEEAAALLEQARDEAAALLESAREAASAGRAQGREVGLAAGREQGYVQGFEQGRELGREQAFDEAAAKLAELTAALESSLAAFEAERDTLLSSAADGVTQLAVAIAQRVCRKLGELDRSTCLETATAAVRLVGKAQEITLCLHPRDAEHVRSLEPDPLRRWLGIGGIHFTEDPAITPGGCRVQSATGLIDAELETQLDRIAADLLGAAAAVGPPKPD